MEHIKLLEMLKGANESPQRALFSDGLICDVWLDKGQIELIMRYKRRTVSWWRAEEMREIVYDGGYRWELRRFGDGAFWAKIFKT